MLRTTVFLSLLLFVPLTSAGADPAKKLKSRELDDRLEAIEEIRRDGHEKAEKLLLSALRDRDWEVVERAAEALGDRGGKESTEDLMRLCLTAPAVRIRQAAARSLGKLDKSSVETLTRAAGNEEFAAAAFDALAIVGMPERPKAAVEAVTAGLASKKPEIRYAAARAFILFDPQSGATRLRRLIGDEQIEVTASALSTVIDYPDPAYLQELVGSAGASFLDDTVERRILAAIHAIIAAAEPGEVATKLAAPALAALKAGGDPEAMARKARLLGILGELPPQPEADDADSAPRLLPASTVLEALEPALKSAEPVVRSAAVHALGRIGSEAALDRAIVMAKSDEHPRVRMHALRAAVSRRNVLHEGTFQMATDRLRYDEDLLVREEAAVALGVAGAQGAVPTMAAALEAAMAEPRTRWALGACICVSLGKTRDPAALPVLVATLKNARDWRIGAAALVGLGHLRLKEAVPSLIDALGARDPVFPSTAYEFLRRMVDPKLTPDKMPPVVKVWRDWWQEVGEGYVFVDRDREAREAKKYGYAVTRQGVYEGLDVIVLQSRGDTIEKLLDKMEIQHRVTRAGQIPKDGLHPFALFVSNCTGEISPVDIEQLQWFVRVGGYLFCSCWALTHTAEKVYPGIEGYESVVTKVPSKGNVLDNVPSEPCPTRSPYLEGVFPSFTRPIYVLYGSHLIQVKDKERVEVLIDSPWCATRWDGGNLAAWFQAGHGVILDSANHFDLQGMEKAVGLKTAEDRMGYAVNHMGIDYPELRELRDRKVWDSSSASKKEARDLSAFRFITNFVREKRKQE